MLKGNEKRMIISIIGLFFVSCGNVDVEDCGCTSSADDSKLKNIIQSKNLTGDALKEKVVPKISDDKAQLGMHLFFSKSLGADRDAACVTCHHPMLGGGDNLSLPIGVGAVNPDLLGTGRLHASGSTNYDGGPLVPRNAPTTFNIVGWNKSLFHDGRLTQLNASDISTPDSGQNIKDELATANLASAQSRFPITSNEEMKGFEHADKDNQEIREYVASRIGGYGEGKDELNDTAYWLKKFKTALSKPNGTAEELITEQNIAMLIGEYENSQAFVDTPWKAYVEGNANALSASEKKGALLFFTSIEDGGADCASCHSGDFFTDEKFHNIAMPQFGHGKGSGDEGIEDFGRMLATSDANDKYGFRTPTLLNVEVTGPWGHTGAYTSLEAVVRHHLNAKEAIENYDVSQLVQTGLQNLEQLKVNTNKAVKHLEEARKEGLDVLKNNTLSDVEVNNLIDFLHTLTDPCVKNEECLSKWIPKLNDDPNGDQLDAIDVKGNILGRE